MHEMGGMCLQNSTHFLKPNNSLHFSNTSIALLYMCMSEKHKLHLFKATCLEVYTHQVTTLSPQGNYEKKIKSKIDVKTS